MRTWENQQDSASCHIFASVVAAAFHYRNGTGISDAEAFSRNAVNKGFTALKELIKEHVSYTNSEKGKLILENFGEYLPKFKKIIPHDYETMLNQIIPLRYQIVQRAS